MTETDKIMLDIAGQCRRIAERAPAHIRSRLILNAEKFEALAAAVLNDADKAADNGSCFVARAAGISEAPSQPVKDAIGNVSPAVINRTKRQS